MFGAMTDRSRALLGLVYLLMCALFVAVCVAAYQKALPWEHAVRVRLDAAAAGLELNPHSDVKLQGMRVGEVRSISSDGQTAHIELAIMPEKAHLIPADVDAAIVPTTLFGEKYVDLRRTQHRDERPIADGDVLRQSTTSVEIGTILDHLGSLLAGLEPAQLSVVLNSLATAVNGRGERLASAINQLDGTLRQVNPHLSTATDDLDRVARLSSTLATQAPELKSILTSTTAISANLLIPHEHDLASVLAEIIGTSQTTGQVLGENAQSLITLVGRAQPVTSVLRDYSAELPCVLRGLHTVDNLGTQTMAARGPFLTVTIDMVAHHAPYTYPADLPGQRGNDASNDRLPALVPGWAPHCPQFTAETLALKLAKPGTETLAGSTFGTSRLSTLPNSDRRQAADRTPPTEAGKAPMVPDQVLQARRALARAAAAQMLGLTNTEVPSYVTLLLGPMMSGTVAVP